MESVRKVDKRIDDSGALLIKFARFVNGTLELFEDRPDSCEYVAFSHVWGDWKWRGIPGIPYEVKASQEKADFIENDLPALVGDGAFWMDTLTVDQHNEKEVLDIVQSIPTIFRMAKRTIAVRECDGLYDCCMEAVRDFQTIKEFKSKLYTHCGAHDEFVCNESYLQRLWTLQECLISHTIQFIVAPNSTYMPDLPALTFQDSLTMTSRSTQENQDRKESRLPFLQTPNRPGRCRGRSTCSSILIPRLGQPQRYSRVRQGLCARRHCSQSEQAAAHGKRRPSYWPIPPE